MVKISDAGTYPEPLSWPLLEQCRFARGFADGEGGPRLYYHKARHSSARYANIRMVVLSNTDLPLLATIRAILLKVEVRSHIYLDHRPSENGNRKDAYVLVVSDGRSLKNYQKYIGFTNPRKAEILARIVASYKRFLKTVKSAEGMASFSRP